VLPKPNQLTRLLKATINSKLTNKQVDNLLVQALKIEHYKEETLIGVLIGRFILDGEMLLFNLNQLAVLPKYQNQGVASQLINQLKTDLKNKVSIIQVQCLSQLVLFYEHRGFKKTNQSYLKDKKKYFVLRFIQ
jgi:N-acetylglutamate synthase-like GNAT family acetyltransferase